MRGKMQFLESTTVFADNDWGTGAIVDVAVCPDLDSPLEMHGGTVQLNWIDWNYVEFREIETSLFAIRDFTLAKLESDS